MRSIVARADLLAVIRGLGISRESGVPISGQTQGRRRQESLQLGYPLFLPGELCFQGLYLLVLFLDRFYKHGDETVWPSGM